MELHDRHSLKGLIRIEVRSEGGVLLEVQEVENTVTKSGRTQVRDLLGYSIVGSPGMAPDFVEIGTGSTATTDAMEALVSPVGRYQITRRWPSEVSLQPAMTYQMLLRSADANGYALREVALYSTAYGGKLWNRGVHNVINKILGLSVTYQLTLVVVP